MSAMRFRKRPVEVEAFRYIAEWTTKRQILAFCPIANVGAASSAADPHGENSVDIRWIDIPTLEGSMSVSEGDWIIKGVAGEFYPCKPDIFERTYEAVE